jgi:lysylphosphatidylglycerol synthetase-like protein (DUF2156 family)
MTTQRQAPSFAQQRIIYFAILLGVVMFLVAVAVLQQTNEGRGLATEPIPALDTAAITLGAVLASVAFFARGPLRRRAEQATGPARSQARFLATLVPLAILEGGCLFAIVTWMLNGTMVPSLVVALVLLAAAIAVVPFADPDAGR